MFFKGKKVLRNRTDCEGAYITLLTLRKFVTDITLSPKVVHYAYLGSLEMFYTITCSESQASQH